MEVMTWKGRPVEELSREELLEAVTILGRLYREALERGIANSQLFGLMLQQRR